MQVKRGVHLNEHANYETFPSALLLLFRIATADEWTGIMADMSVQPPHCQIAAGNCGLAAAPVYIMSFALLIGQIMLNLFTTIVIETFEEMDGVWELLSPCLCQLWTFLTHLCTATQYYTRHLSRAKGQQRFPALVPR
jgi:hypothetical protein